MCLVNGEGLRIKTYSLPQLWSATDYQCVIFRNPSLFPVIDLFGKTFRTIVSPRIPHPAAVFGGPFAALVGAGVLDGPIVLKAGIFPVLHGLGQRLVPAAPGLDKLLKT